MTNSTISVHVWVRRSRPEEYLSLRRYLLIILDFIAAVTYPTRTYFVHLDFALGLEQHPSDGHAHEVRSESGPRFVVDLVEQRQRVVNAAEKYRVQIVFVTINIYINDNKNTLCNAHFGMCLLVYAMYPVVNHEATVQNINAAAAALKYLKDRIVRMSCCT